MSDEKAAGVEKKRGAERTQKAVRGEDWSDERLAGFLDLLPPDDLPADYNVLLRAYRGMTPELFVRFVALYRQSGRDLNVTLGNGSTFLDHVSRHRKSQLYADALRAEGAVAHTTLARPA